MQTVLSVFDFRKFYDIFGLWKKIIFSELSNISSLEQFYCLIPAKLGMQVSLLNRHLMMQPILRIFDIWKFHDIFGLWKNFIISSKFTKKSILTTKLLSDSAQTLHDSLFSLLVLDVVNGCGNFDFNSVFLFRKIRKNLSTNTKIVMWLMLLLHFAFNFLYCFVNPIGTWCHCRNTGLRQSPPT